MGTATWTVILTTLAGLSVGGLVALTKQPWFVAWRLKQNPWMRVVIDAVAAGAVAVQNEKLVNADRANPNTGDGVGGVSKVVGAIAKNNAVDAVADTVIDILGQANPAAGRIAESLIPVIETAVEAQVAKAKNPDLPKPSANALAAAMR